MEAVTKEETEESLITWRKWTEMVVILLMILLKANAPLLKKYRTNCRELTVNDRARLSKLKSDLAFSDFFETIDFMLNNNIKLEQEAEN